MERLLIPNRSQTNGRRPPFPQKLYGRIDLPDVQKKPNEMRTTTEAALGVRPKGLSGFEPLNLEEFLAAKRER